MCRVSLIVWATAHKWIQSLTCGMKFYCKILYVIIWSRCNMKRSRRTVFFLPVYKISSLKITPPKTQNSGQFSYPLPNIVSFLFWSAIVPIHILLPLTLPKRERNIDNTCIYQGSIVNVLLNFSPMCIRRSWWNKVDMVTIQTFYMKRL
jgi:hypothetical protein